MRMSTYCIAVQADEDEYLLINSLTGAVDVVDTDVINLLQSDLSQGEPSILNFLHERGHITQASPEEEFEDIRTLYERFTENRKNLHTHMIIPTYDCNLVCPYCFLSDLRKKGTQWLSTVISQELIDKVFEAIAEVDGTEKGRIALYGGEPLMEKTMPAVEEILERGESLGHSFIILTNGVSLCQYMDLLRGRNVTLQVTIDGPKNLHDKRRIRKDGTGSFDQIAAGIDAALKENLRVFLRTNLDSENLGALSEVVDFARKKGWVDNPLLSMHFSPIFEKTCGTYKHSMQRKDVYTAVVSNATSHQELNTVSFDHKGIAVLERLFLKGELGAPRFWYCEANDDMIIYDPFGDLYVCFEHVGDEAGRVGRYDPELKWNEKYSQWRERTIFTIPECKECKYALLCGGGCGFAALEKYGSLDRPLCLEYHEILNVVVPHLYRSRREDLAQT
ncbi:MAG: radical SAM protein [Theionarchaea archaeon]|nr:radical SAM protein [Theionarchaea archaeon]MBU7000426.1 radical SAM protein [Theionarchaea archaeon]MBU7021268.1 radical SAM protein [Theionarchaea archaeon]MBU7035289.1 radical SAM protein [Theionarchaea archaeon]MBU7039760.1 radical SAM protein [Theionarchaea archaeon]